MTRISPRHPRYRSLVVRAALAEATRRGLVVPEGLIAHGRGEAFDYLLGERTTASAARAERTAAEWLRAARRPVVSVNGNVAALAAGEVARLQRAVPGLLVEVNLFHRTDARADRIARRLLRAGVSNPLGRRPTARIPGLPSDRALVDRRGLYHADVALIPLEDGDRAEALKRRGLRVIAIDLNPLSRTSRAADLPIVDELRRALAGIAAAAERPRSVRPSPRAPTAAYLRRAAQAEMAAGLRRASRPDPRSRAPSRG